MSVDEGGLGIRQIKDIAQAFTFKLWWRMRQNKSLWSLYMHNRYVKDAHPTTIPLAHNSSVVRKRMWLVRNEVEQQLF